MNEVAMYELKKAMGYTDDVHDRCLDCRHSLEFVDQADMWHRNCVLNPCVSIRVEDHGRCNFFDRPAKKGGAAS